MDDEIEKSGNTVDEADVSGNSDVAENTVSAGSGETVKTPDGEILPETGKAIAEIMDADENSSTAEKPVNEESVSEKTDAEETVIEKTAVEESLAKEAVEEDPVSEDPVVEELFTEETVSEGDSRTNSAVDTPDIDKPVYEAVKDTSDNIHPNHNASAGEPDVSIPVRRKKKSKAIHLAWIIPAAAAGIVAGVIVGGAQNYKERFWKNTYFGDMYVGGKTVEEVNSSLKNDNKELKITTREGNIETIALDDIGYKSSFSTDIQSIKDSQSPYEWFLHNSGENVYDVDINTSYDEKALEEKLAGLDCIISDSIQDPTDAHLALVGDSFTIVEATEGNRIIPEKLNSVVSQAIKSGVFDVNLSDSDCYVAPKVYGDDAELNTTLNNINALKGTSVKLNLREAEEIIDYKLFKDWIHTEGTQPVLDDDQILAYLDGIAEKYNTYMTERDFQATGLGTIKVGAGPQDSYGFLLDEESTKDAIKEALLTGSSDTVDCYWDVPANHRNQPNGDIGNTYVEIDISRQHMWYYKDGQLFTDTDVRTGTESSAQWTPTTEGVYRILWKQRDKWFLQVGEPCHSDYWMPFNSRGEGIHDATWYSTYGGNLYKWAGSHGCINTPYNIAKLIYENIEEGTPVIVYRS